MPQREWTASTTVLPQAMRELAVKMAREANEATVLDNDAARLRNFLRDEAYTLSEWADAVEQLYARLPDGQPHTNAQGVALVKRINERTRRVIVTPQPFDLPPGYLGVVYEDDGAGPFTCGIDVDGVMSS